MREEKDAMSREEGAPVGTSLSKYCVAREQDNKATARKASKVEIRKVIS